jgi:hypothetical protein
MEAEVIRDMRQAEKEIAAADCPTACRALGSMERSVTFLCAPTHTGDDAGRCEDGKRRVLTARRRIRTTCGLCPGGPSVDPDAPIPSTKR